MPAQSRLLTVRLQQQVADKIGTGPRAVMEAEKGRPWRRRRGRSQQQETVSQCVDAAFIFA